MVAQQQQIAEQILAQRRQQAQAQQQPPAPAQHQQPQQPQQPQQLPPGQHQAQAQEGDPGVC